MPRKTVYSVALMSRWGPSRLAATPSLLSLIFPESFRQACAATLCPSRPFLLGLSPVRGEGKLRQRAL